MKRLIDDEVVRRIHNQYMNGQSAKALARDLRCDYRCLLNNFRRLNLEIINSRSWSKKGLIKDFFKEINNQDKAYILGLIMADGNVCNKTLKIKLHRSDRELLVKVSKEIQGQEKLYEYDSEPNASVLQISSMELVNDLYKWGVEPRKTYKYIKLPDIKPELLRHFIRGFFDGDGSAGVYPFTTGIQRNFQFTCACKSFLEDIKKYLTHHLQIDGGCISLKPKGSSIIRGKQITSIIDCYTLAYRKREDLIKIYQHLYKSANLYLPRKKDKLYMAGLTPSELEDLKIF